MNWKNTPKTTKARVKKVDKKAEHEGIKADRRTDNNKKGKSGGDPHGRTTKEKVVDFAKGVGLTSGQKKVRDFAIGGAALATGGLGNLASRAANIVKKAHAHKKE